MSSAVGTIPSYTFLLFCSIVFSQIWPGFSICGNISEIMRDCVNGKCVDNECKCDQGWAGELCDECGGRLILTEDSGYVTDGAKDYAKARECSWVIQPKSKSNATIRLRLMEFATECGWDYLYIFDGDSASAPLLATFNGLIVVRDKDTSEAEKYFPEVVATSGSVFIHFFSDIEYVMKGFNISYAIQSCPQKCSSHGDCIVSVSNPQCSCNAGWIGSGCEFESCPGNCLDVLNQGYCKNSTTPGNAGNMCFCSEGYQGSGCGSRTPAQKGFWTGTGVSDAPFNAARSSHSVVVLEDTMWLCGGIQFGNITSEGGFDMYNFTSNEWHREDATTQNAPSSRYGHSAVLYEGMILVFGGRDLATSHARGELWQFDLDAKLWTKVSYTEDFSTKNNKTMSPLALWGHTGTLVQLRNGTNIMLVMFGFHTEYEYSGFVFEYDLGTKIWRRALTNGAKIEAAFEHTTTWDPINGVCYIHGVFTFLKHSYKMTDYLYSYQPDRRTFSILRSSGVPRYLHTAFLSEGVLFIYGGCAHNDSTRSTGALCFSPSFMAYHIACDTWEDLPPLDSHYDSARYGHVAFAVNGKGENTLVIAVHGGYNGKVLGTTLMYQTASCHAFSGYASECAESHPGLSCMWNGTNCVAARILGSYKFQNVSCQRLVDHSPRYCQKLSTCDSCLNTIADCSWCGNGCSVECSSNQMPAESCEDDIPSYCQRFRTCGQCEINSECQWTESGCMERTSNDTTQCPDSCGMLTSCDSCVSMPCMWCSNKGLCVSTMSYVVQFPYGECMKWINKKDQCPATGGCEDHRTCDECLADPFCGWCDDGSHTGLGLCHTGSSSGSQTSNSSQNVISYNRIAEYNLTTPACLTDSWYFTSCPICQCNGHSKCFNGTPDCISCGGHTEGERCEKCSDGYFGVATNGGTCKPCECFNRAILCEHTTGVCYCSTKGVTGDICEKCDNDAKYYGDPRKNGTCFYKLLINYTFTFTLTKLHDEYIRAINFENTPPQKDNADLNFQSSEPCTVRLTVYSLRRMSVGGFNTSEDDFQYEEDEVYVTTVSNVEKFSFDFSGSEYGFGDPSTNTTIRIYVSNFSIPMQIQVSLVQRNSFLLMLLLILFSVFLVLLLLTALAWKLKTLYDSCQQRRQHAVQLEQMAARPFTSVFVCLDDVHFDKPAQVKPTSVITGVTEEACESGQAAAISVALWMPSGNGIKLGNSHNKDDEKANLLEESGALAIGTALVCRKSSSRDSNFVDQNTSSKSHGKNLKIVFKRSRRPTGASTRQTNQPRVERHPSGSAGSSQVVNIENCHRGTNDPAQSNRPLGKRGQSSFSSLRSRSVSPGNNNPENSRRSLRRSEDTSTVPAFSTHGHCTNSRSEGISM